MTTVTVRYQTRMVSNFMAEQRGVRRKQAFFGTAYIAVAIRAQSSRS